MLIARQTSFGDHFVHADEAWRTNQHEHKRTANGWLDR